VPDADRGVGTLFVVATPIGNLGDVTVRALEVLRGVTLIAAEDTRISRRLLDRHGIETRLTSYHARSGPGRLAELLRHLREGADLALVTDAGTPGVSDPGEDLVAAWATEGGRVVPIPGPSAVLAAVAASGLAGPRWGFDGFLPRGGRERRERIERIALDDRATILYEAPTRLAATIRDLEAACGTDRPAAICRELTKIHEQIVRGPLGALGAAIAAGTIPQRGEVVVIVAGVKRGTTGSLNARDSPADASRDRGSGELALEAAMGEVDRLVESGVARGEATRRIAAATGIHRRRLYRPPAPGA
jgi:16S rRNA (cytidine1402-2'-O)-methyltransferase